MKIERWIRVIRLPSGGEIVNLLSNKPEATADNSTEIRIEVDLEKPVGERVREYEDTSC